ncbi:MAG: zinc-binding dehydrogenase [Marmoricola sp.]
MTTGTGSDSPLPSSTRAILALGPEQPFAMEEIELDALREDEALVQVVATGLCHTDLTVPKMMPPEFFPRVLGHEGAGIVVAVGPGDGPVKPGDHVVMSFRACRSCANCAELGPGYCTETLMLNYMGMRADGSTTYRKGEQPVFGSFFGQSSFGEYAVTGTENLVVVDPALDLKRLGPYGCSFQTGAGTVLNVLRSTASDTVVVYGVGAVGLAALAAAAAVGARTFAVDLKPERLEAAARFGATGIPAAGLAPDELVAAVVEATGGPNGHRQAIDTTGVPSVVRAAVAAVGAHGEVVALGLNAPEYTVDAIDLLQGGKTLRSSIEGDSDPQVTIPQLLELAAAGKFAIDDLIQEYPADQINQAAADLESGAAIKPVLVW